MSDFFGTIAIVIGEITMATPTMVSSEMVNSMVKARLPLVRTLNGQEIDTSVSSETVPHIEAPTPLGSGLVFESLGARKLKGVPEEWSLFAVGE